MGLDASILIISMPICFRCIYFSVLSCSAAGIIILLPFSAMSAMIVISCLKYQHGYRYVCTSGLVSGNPWSMSSEGMPMCSLSVLAVLISSAVMQPSRSMYDTTALMVMHMPRISSSLFGLWLCLDCQPVMKTFDPAYCILMLYWCILNIILRSLYNRLAISFFKASVFNMVVVFLPCRMSWFCFSW